jgi:hypothetical protein
MTVTQAFELRVAVEYTRVAEPLDELRVVGVRVDLVALTLVTRDDAALARLDASRSRGPDE